MKTTLGSTEKATASLGILKFTEFTYPRYQPDLFHHLVGEALDHVVAGRITKLMIFAPPQHGKSELVSVRLPAYWLGRRTDDPIVLASYEANLAKSKSKQARSIVESDEYQYWFPGVQTAADSRAGDLWQIVDEESDDDAQVRSAGVGGGLTGHPGHLGIIDDPVKNRKDANSQVMRDGAWEWWTSTYRTRIAENGSHVLIMTRWHYDDLAGRLMSNQGAIDYSEWLDGKDPGQGWVVMRCPALAETQEARDDANRLMGMPPGLPDPLNRNPGEPLSPSRFSREALLAIRDDIGPRDWASLYQGTPRPSESNLFEVDEISVTHTIDVAMKRIVRYWDLAATQDGGARSAGVKLGEGFDSQYYIMDLVAGHWSPANVDKKLIETAERDGKGVEVWLEEEGGSSGKFAKRHFLNLLKGWTVWFDKVHDSKGVRWGPCASQMAGGAFVMVSAPWNTEMIEELEMQPDAPLKDITDALSGAFAQLHDDKRMGSASIDLFNPAKYRQAVEVEPAMSPADVRAEMAKVEKMTREMTADGQYI